MKAILVATLSILAVCSALAFNRGNAGQGGAVKPAGEYAQHFAALGKLSITIAQTMPAEQYEFKPDPPSMTFGEQMAHIAQTNFAYCAGLNDVKRPADPTLTNKESIVKFLADSYQYCGEAIPNLTEKQLTDRHPSPDGFLTGREILLVMYVHVAHHRGQAEIYLRDKGIKPPSFIF